ncbi:MAG TPA: HRDC domain-containing protein [Gemmatimonadales bacterium]|jgi:ribonuclease D|nr:HRDC domain-containing protein [Gemmatimonadales bacterium]
MNVRLVDEPAAFVTLMAEIAGAPLVAMDTEAASFHRFIDRIYLIQLSTPTTTAVVDPLGVGDLAPIGALLADAAVEKVFHDAAYDLRLFDKEFGFHARHLFDTRIAAQLLNEPGIGLAALLEKYFGVRPDKRFQRADWSARPLTAPMLDYAAGDTSHLCELRDILLNRLREMGRLEWAMEEFELLENIRWTAPQAAPETDFIEMKGARALDRRGLALLRELYIWREQTAHALDRAQFRVLGNEVLLHLSQHPVATPEELSHVRGIGRDTLERRGDEILAAIARGLAVADEALPRFARSPRRVPDPAYELRLGRLKLRRNAIATRLDLAPGVLCPNGTLEAIARVLPQDLAALGAIHEVRRWQVKEFGSELLEALHEPENAASGETV